MGDWYGGRGKEGDIYRRLILDEHFKSWSYGLESLIEVIREDSLIGC